jgi:hypothetical protein
VGRRAFVAACVRARSGRETIQPDFKVMLAVDWRDSTAAQPDAAFGSCYRESGRRAFVIEWTVATHEKPSETTKPLESGFVDSGVEA